jgi:hypothetical protein
MERPGCPDGLAAGRISGLAREEQGEEFGSNGGDPVRDRLPQISGFDYLLEKILVLP